MQFNALIKAITTAIVVPVAMWVGWMLADRTKPFTRESGEIIAWDFSQCNLEPNADLGRVAANACVAVKWNITIDEARLLACDIASTEHVNRIITDRNGTHELPKTKNTFGGATGRPFENPLIRPFVLPPWSVEGPAVYWSESRYVCNWLQRLFPDTLAIRINEPVIPYFVETSLVR